MCVVFGYLILLKTDFIFSNVKTEDIQSLSLVAKCEQIVAFKEILYNRRNSLTRSSLPSNSQQGLGHRNGHKEKALTIFRLSMLHNSVGVTGIEPATSRPPDAHSNRTELHPELRVQKYNFFFTLQTFCKKNAEWQKKNAEFPFLECG